MPASIWVLETLMRNESKCKWADVQRSCSLAPDNLSILRRSHTSRGSASAYLARLRENRMPMGASRGTKDTRLNLRQPLEDKPAQNNRRCQSLLF